jgi:uncharacterized protein YbjT (DUF2867 family)
MGNSDKIVLVTGATGRQGGAVIRHMQPKGWKLRALTRNTNSQSAQALARQGVELVKGDLEDPTSLERAARGAYGIYSVQDFWAVGAKREVQQGKNLADAAKKVGVEHLVYSSVGGAERNSGIAPWETKWEIEKYTRSLKLPVTVLRPVAFMETYHVLDVEIGLLKGTLTVPIRGDQPLQTIATDDIGAFVALAFERPKEFIGMALEIGGSELTRLQTAEAFSRVLNRPVKLQRVPMFVLKLVLDKEFYKIFRWFFDGGFKANIPELRRKYPEVRLRTLEEWLREDGWGKRGLRFTSPRNST